jgi:Glycosyl transferase family 2
MSDRAQCPVVHLYALCWNEERLLPFFFRHYDPFVTRYFIFDHNSTDHSRQILKAHPRVTLGKFKVRGDSYISKARDFYNHA